MALVKERAAILSEILLADESRAKHFLSLAPEEALDEINALGYDFTLDEIIAYGEELKKASAQGELDVDALDDVSGGSVALVVAGAVGIAFGAGAIVGGLEKAKVW